ncbi:hypothetical protein [Streptomyces sp. 6N223]
MRYRKAAIGDRAWCSQPGCGLRVLAKVAEDRKALEDVVEGAVAAL